MKADYIIDSMYSLIPSNLFCYALVKNNEIQYIGQTKVGMRRIQTHEIVRRIKPTEIHIWLSDYPYILERKLIRLYRPKYNKDF